MISIFHPSKFLKRSKAATILALAAIPYANAQHDGHAAGPAPDHSAHASASSGTPSGHTANAHPQDMPNMVSGRVPVMVSEGQRQLVNIRTTNARIQPATVQMRTVGIVAYDDTHIENINTRIMGWADTLLVDKPGQRVEKGAPLLEIYSPELYSAQQEYLLAYEHCQKLHHLQNQTEEVSEALNTGLTLLDSARKRLKLWEITDEEIASLEKAGVASDRLIIRSPVSGFVIDKNIDPGQMIRPGMTLYRIADLNTVWINADVYEYELSLFRHGQEARVIAKAYPERSFPAKVDFIYPFSETRTRTTTARLVIDNFESLLKPGMYVDVVIDRDLGMQLMIPKEAVFDTGNRQYVFVEANPGHFEPRSIRIGTKVGDQFIVTEGITEGEKIVIDGNFLLDSESQLKASGGGGGHNH